MKQETQEKTLENLIRQNLRYELAIEDYELDTNNEPALLIANLKKLNTWRNNRKIWTIEKQIQETSIIYENFKNIVEEIGKEYFIFYDDGDINYNWKKKEGKNL